MSKFFVYAAVLFVSGIAYAGDESGAGSPDNAKIIGETHYLEPQGEYKNVDTRAADKAAAVLLSTDAQARQSMMKEIRENSGKYSPPALFMLSKAMFDAGMKDEAVFWYYAGSLRAHYDAARCADATARQAAAILDMAFRQDAGTDLRKHALGDPDKFKETIRQVAEWDRSTPHNYDQRWINAHGMGAIRESLKPGTGPQEMSVPEDQWEGIAEKNRQDFLEGMIKAIDQIAPAIKEKGYMPEAGFFPPEKAIRDGYKITNKEWVVLTDYQKRSFIFEGIRVIEEKDCENILKSGKLGYTKDIVSAMDEITGKSDPDATLYDSLIEYLKQRGVYKGGT